MNSVEVEGVLAIAAEAAAADGVEHLDEAARLELTHRPSTVGGVVNESGFAIITGSTLAVVVRPDRRGHERARVLLSRIPGAARSAWSHADHPAARHLAQEYGWRRDRDLLRMIRDADADVDPGPGCGGGPEEGSGRVGTTRGYSPGDEAEFLRVNAAAFDRHPEQGALTAEGFRERLAEPWFDPDDLVEVWDQDRLAAFHWVKRQSSLGEVYVLAVDPAYGGRGLGAYVLRAGLERLKGLPVQLYVEAGNAKARRLYESAGFAIAEVHARYARP